MKLIIDVDIDDYPAYDYGLVDIIQSAFQVSASVKNRHVRRPRVLPMAIPADVPPFEPLKIRRVVRFQIDGAITLNAIQRQFFDHFQCEITPVLSYPVDATQRHFLEEKPDERSH